MLLAKNKLIGKNKRLRYSLSQNKFKMGHGYMGKKDYNFKN